MDETSVNVKNETEDIQVRKTDEDIEDFLKNANVKQEPAEEETEGDVGDAVMYGDIVIHEPDIKSECKRASWEANLTSVASSSSECANDIVFPEGSKQNKMRRNGPEFVCNICAKKFSHKSNLTAHKLIHTGETPFECNVCMKKFNQRSSLTRHKRIHTEEKPYECDVCMKKLSRASILKKHKLTHTEGKSFKCNICLSNFNTLLTLNTHKSTHSGEIFSNMLFG